MALLTKTVNYNNPDSLVNQFRNKRFELFEGKLATVRQKEIKILDVGGTESFWINRGYHQRPNIQLTLLNIFPQKTQYANMRGHIGDATNMVEFADESFDIVFSNSVIEHLFTFDNQQRMASEVQRVSTRHFIQTPNRYFFMEPHFLMPYFQFYPKPLKLWILSQTKLARGYRYPSEDARKRLDEIKLLSKAQMLSLFPQSTLYEEKVFGLVKSFTAHNF